MKILLIVDDYLPYSIKVAAKMMHELACEFVNRGYNVSVVTPDYKIDNTFKTEVIDGVGVYYFKSGRIKNVHLLIRAINEFLLPFRALLNLRKILNKQPHDLVIYYSPSIFWGPYVYLLKKRWGVPSFLVLRDIFPQWVIDNGTLSSWSPVTVFFKLFERINYRSADCIALQSPKNQDWFKARHKYKYNTTILYNWSKNSKTSSDGSFRKSYEIQGKTLFFYGGNVGRAQDMGNILRLAERMLPEKNAYFVILGDGDEVELVKEIIESKKLVNTLYLPPVDQVEFRLILSEIDIGLFSLNREHTTQNFPGKLLGYMAQGIPILGSINPGNDLKDVIEKHNAGLISVNGDDELFYTNAHKFLKDKKIRKTIGENANRLLSELFSVESAADEIINFYQNRKK